MIWIARRTLGITRFFAGQVWTKAAVNEMAVVWINNLIDLIDPTLSPDVSNVS